MSDQVLGSLVAAVWLIGALVYLIWEMTNWLDKR